MNDTVVREWTHEGRPELTRQSAIAPEGPWLHEPDKRHWIDPATDLDCLMVRNRMGAWCGYVAVTEGHPYFESDYGHCEAEVHGGLTFAAFCRESEEGEGHGICHRPFAGRPERVWWLGFDCAHAFDLIPYMMAEGFGGATGDVYRDVAYVQGECESLARQLKAAA